MKKRKKLKHKIHCKHIEKMRKKNLEETVAQTETANFKVIELVIFHSFVFYFSC